MLDNLLIAYQQTGREIEAMSLIKEARARPRHSGSLIRFDLFHALREACDDNPEPGRRLLETTLTSQLDRYEANWHELLSVALQFFPESGPPPGFDAELQKRLLGAYQGLRRYRAARQSFVAITRMISRRLGRAWPRWWAWFQ